MRIRWALVWVAAVAVVTLAGTWFGMTTTLVLTGA